jgi:hypothetical protein
VRGDVAADSARVLLLASKLGFVILSIRFRVTTAEQNKAEVLLVLRSLSLLCVPCLAVLFAARSEHGRDLWFTAHKRPVKCNGVCLESDSKAPSRAY